MSCYHPLKGFRTPSGVVFSELGRHDILGDIEIPCGQCIGCRMRRASDWTIRVMHEASLHSENCFVTLTYGRDKLPPDGSLEHRDFQLFMKRLRRHFGKTVRFYMCGEYGPLNFRPHYHACLFNVNFISDRVPAGKSGSGAVFYDSPTLEEALGAWACLSAGSDKGDCWLLCSVYHGEAPWYFERGGHGSVRDRRRSNPSSGVHRHEARYWCFLV